MTIYTTNLGAIRSVQGQHDVTIAAGQSRSFGIVMALRNVNGQALSSGQYSLRIKIKGAQTMAGSASVQTNIRTEYQFMFCGPTNL